MSSIAGKRVLVTGVTGFVGSALAARLVSEGVHVRALSRKVPASPDVSGLEWMAGDLQDEDRIAEVTRDMDAVLHVGGMVGQYGSRDEYLRINVGGAHNIIAACRKNGIPSLVFTSTPSVIADGTPHFNVDESAPYSTRFESPYSESKALAEQAVIAANGRELRTVCIRPHMIWGAASTHWVHGLRKRAMKKQLYQIGNGRNRVGMTFIDDCVEAHVCALQALEGDARVGGQPFFVHSGNPVYLWEWVRQLTEALGLPGIRGTIPEAPVKALAKIFDAIATASGGSLHFPISSYLITELTTDHYSNIDRARSWLGYVPRVSVAEGIARMAGATA